MQGFIGGHTVDEWVMEESEEKKLRENIDYRFYSKSCNMLQYFTACLKITKLNLMAKQTRK